MSSNDESVTLEKLLNDGWDYHNDDSMRLARELEAAWESGVTPRFVAPFLHLYAHAVGEHLGDWERVLKFGNRILDGYAPASEMAKAWGWLYVAAVLAGDPVAAVELELSYLKTAGGDDFCAAALDLRFMLAGVLVGTKRADEGNRLYRSALDLVVRIPQSAALDRTIAVTSNNLGWELYEMPSRTADDDTLMQLAAETSLQFWRRCGNWINAERGLHLKSVVATVTGDPTSGLAHADAALALIDANGERPLDAARLHLARSMAFAALRDADGRRRAMSDADAAAAKLTATNLKAEFAADRNKVVVAHP
jgi:hypothetical protein